jgi:hypothetical protein
MEGKPKVDSLFGDSTAFRTEVDHYLALYDSMQRVRDHFSRSVQTVLTTLAARPSTIVKRSCPEDAIALPYAESFHLGQDFQRSGAELERLYATIKELDALGETAGLTPDYRWKVKRALTLHKEVLTDWNEMKAVFADHLGAELTFFNCDASALVEKGESAGADALAKASSDAPALPAKAAESSKKKAKVDAPPAVAATAAFTIDNMACATPTRLYLDGQLMGPVAANAKATFSSLVGPHDLCLIPSESPQHCGDLGTVRKTYIHQGWTIQLRCGN